MGHLTFVIAKDMTYFENDVVPLFNKYKTDK